MSTTVMVVVVSSSVSVMMVVVVVMVAARSWRFWQSRVRKVSVRLGGDELAVVAAVHPVVGNKQPEPGEELP